MQRAGIRYAVGVGILVAGGLGVRAQAPAAAPAPAHSIPASSPASISASEPAAAGGHLHGVVKSGSIPLPGVTVTAQNTLSGKRYSTATDITGGWSMNIPENGRYVVRTEFAAFAASTQEALFNAAHHDQAVDFSLVLASRAAEQEQKEERRASAAENAQAVRQLGGNGAESVSLMSVMGQGTDAGSAGQAGTELPAVADNSDFGGDSVAISGQSGQVSALAGVDVDRLRDAMERSRDHGGGSLDMTGGMGGLGGGFGGDSGMMGSSNSFMGGRGGSFGGHGGPGGFTGGHGNFRGFNPGQPHGAIYWSGNNSALNAEPFALRGQQQFQPASGTNRFGLTFMSAPYLPGLTQPSGKDTLFLALSGQRSASPSDQYATVPTDAERGGDFSAAGLGPIYDPLTGQQFSYNGQLNVIPPARFAGSPAVALLSCPNPVSSGAGCKPFLPEPNLPGTVQNYHLLTTAQSNNNLAGIRYMRGLGANAAQVGRRGAGRHGSTNQGLTQSINFNYNWAHSAQDLRALSPQLGGKTATNSYAFSAGYTVGYNKFTSIFSAGWNRNRAQTINYFTNTSNDIAAALGIAVPNQIPVNYGVPNVALTGMSGLSEQQPSFKLTQTISFTETMSWIRGKHNIRFGGEFRRVHRDFVAGSNGTGSFTFTGLFTEDAAHDASTGSPVADLLLGYPQATSIDSSVAKSYLRDNNTSAYVQDDWRVLPQLTLLYGVRYEYFAPYTEKFGQLADVLTNPAGGFTSMTEALAGTAGLPASLVYPWHKAFAPRLGFALRLPRQTVIRAGFGMNYSVGEYATFATTMAHQPPFANLQINQEAAASGKPSTACLQSSTSPCFTLAHGFMAQPPAVGSFALDPHYPLPYVQAWNLDIQKTLPWQMVLNIGYNGSKGNHLDMKSAPRATPGSTGTNPGNVTFKYDQATAFSKYGAATVRLNKRLSKGVALGANYQYAHSIDNAGSVNGTASVVAQNWQNLAAEEGNSSFDVRHRVSGTYLMELPFGPDKYWITSGPAAHILEGFSVSGSFTFATGTPLSPYYSATTISVACGTSGAFRPNLTGASVSAGGGALKHWFNPAAYSAPVAAYPDQFPCYDYGNAPRNSIAGPGTVSNNMALAKTVQMGDTRSLEIRASLSNAFNTVQYSGVDTNVASPSFGQVTSVGAMRSFNFMARYRF